MGRHTSGRQNGEDAENPSEEGSEQFTQWLGHLTGDGPDLSYRWPEDATSSPASPSSPSAPPSRDSASEEQPYIHPAYRWDLPAKPKPAGDDGMVFDRQVRPDRGQPYAAPVPDQPSPEVTYRWPEEPTEIAGAPQTVEISGPEPVDLASRSRFGKAALLSGISVLAAVGLTFAGVRLVGSNTSLVLEPPAASCAPGTCEAAPARTGALPDPLDTATATPEAAPTTASPEPSPSEAEAAPVKVKSAPSPSAVRPTPSRTPKPKKSATPSPTPTEEPTRADVGLEEGGEPSGTSPSPSPARLRSAVPHVTVGFEVFQEDPEGYSARLIVQTDRDISGLSLTIPFTGELLTVGGAEATVHGDRLTLTSATPLLAGEELVISLIANGTPEPPAECTVKGGDCAIAGPPSIG
ncbi:hypothetical protein [Acrocarpospora catenulata]|uniref:hypothetical protein n=1 Tax=Acrocarpospora catenulata TaxID=2836182 RepID=UPI001BDB41E7|nr:hypothetical protein [Acrocarpospora catenulata]